MAANPIPVPEIAAARAAGVPAFVAPESTMRALRERRRLRRLMRDLAEGRWKDLFLKARETQNFWQVALKGVEGSWSKVEAEIHALNLVDRAIEVHAEIIASNAAKLSAPEESAFDRQREVINEIRDRCMWDALMMEAADNAYTDSEAILRAMVGAAGQVVICLESPDDWLAVGGDGPDGQPSVFERRWIIERASPNGRDRKTYLRIERHRLAITESGPRAVVEQEAYRTESSDVLQRVAPGDEKVKRVPLAEAIADASAVPADLVILSTERVPVVRLMPRRKRGQPHWLIGEEDLKAFDELAASLTRLAISHGRYAEPIMRVLEEMVSKDDGQIIKPRYVVDAEQRVGYIEATLKLDEQLRYVKERMRWLNVKMRVSGVLLGDRLQEGASPDTYEKLSLESTPAMTQGQRAQRYFEPALSHVWTAACELAASAPLPEGGFTSGRVGVRLKPELPARMIDRVREQREALEAGLTSEARALRVVHGDEEADEVAAEIASDRDSATQRKQREFGLAVGAGAEGGSSQGADVPEGAAA